MGFAEQGLFDNDGKLKELEEAEVVYYSPETLGNIRSKQFLLRMDDQFSLSSEQVSNNERFNLRHVTYTSRHVTSRTTNIT